jgi:hypothetical protein
MLKMHMEGLKRMISIRGGLGAIRETNPMIANSVFWLASILCVRLIWADMFCIGCL